MAPHILQPLKAVPASRPSAKIERSTWAGAERAWDRAVTASLASAGAVEFADRAVSVPEVLRGAPAALEALDIKTRDSG
jgi:hypothetical protein